MTQARFRTSLTLPGVLAAGALGHALLADFGTPVQAATVDASAAAAPIAAVTGSLYDRMGGTPTVTAVVNDLIDRVAHDPRTERAFEDVNLNYVKKLLAEHICSLTGGGCTYTGDSMRDVHAGLKIDQSEYYGLVEVMRDTLRQHGVGLRERNELLQILAPMKRDIVER